MSPEPVALALDFREAVAAVDRLTEAIDQAGLAVLR
jgi:hypothetical protein